jgi:hypothetical protein
MGGNIIGKPNTSTTTVGSGLWKRNEQYNARLGNNWPLQWLNTANKFPNTLNIFAWTSTTANACTLSSDTTVTDSPYGGIPLKMAITGADPHNAKYNTLASNITPAINGETWEIRVLAKASVATTGEIYIFGANSSGIWAGAGTGGINLPIVAKTITIGTTWSEFSHTITMDQPQVAFLQSRLDGTHAGGVGINIWWDGWQAYKIS